MNITPEMKMSEVIFHNYQLLPVITRFGIMLGFGEKTVAAVCADYRVNLDFFLEITNSVVDEDYIPRKELLSFPVSLVVDYLHKTHKYYLEDKFPEIEAMIHEMVYCDEGETEKRMLVKNFFDEYKAEFLNHINREDLKVQPYVLAIEEAFLHRKLPKDLLRQIKKYSINDFASEHDNIEEKLNDLKNIIIKYLPPCSHPSLYNKILLELFLLEKDLNMHASLEDKVMIPKVALMEKILLLNYQ